MADRRATILSEQTAEAGRKSRFLQKLEGASQTSLSSPSEGQEANSVSQMGFTSGLQTAPGAMNGAMLAKSAREI